MWNHGISKRIPDKSLDSKIHTKATTNLSATSLTRIKDNSGWKSDIFKSYLGWAVGQSPIYAESGKGAILTDIDGNEYIDYMMALLPVVLGYADPFVDSAVAEQMSKGVSLSLPGRIEADLAEKLTALIPCAEMVRFGKMVLTPQPLLCALHERTIVEIKL